MKKDVSKLNETATSHSVSIKKLEMQMSQISSHLNPRPKEAKSPIGDSPNMSASLTWKAIGTTWLARGSIKLGRLKYHSALHRVGQKTSIGQFWPNQGKFEYPEGIVRGTNLARWATRRVRSSSSSGSTEDPAILIPIVKEGPTILIPIVQEGPATLNLIGPAILIFIVYEGPATLNPIVQEDHATSHCPGRRVLLHPIVHEGPALLIPIVQEGPATSHCPGGRVMLHSIVQEGPVILIPIVQEGPAILIPIVQEGPAILIPIVQKGPSTLNLIV
ncbi:hypothetical protein H5410_057163 [Solanum commersonii]|uniref:Uncharacterized protein n=1 Tax=Solanum commersonii TaxID=4109 RepID=A0A9J5WNW3_SOLCO|nr:hypothetical protein H5410_057163 [Solanum commersonii]